MQQLDSLLLIAGLLFFVDQFIEFWIFVFDPLTDSRTIILIVNRIGIDGRAADVIKGKLSAVDSFSTPKDHEFLRNKLGLDADFCKLIGDNLANFTCFGVTVRGEIKFDVQTVGKAGAGEKLLGLLRIVRITLHLGIEANHVGTKRPIHDVAVSLVDVLNDHRWIDGVVKRLAHLFIVEGLVRDVHGEKVHPHAFGLLGADFRIVGETRELFHRHVVDDIALSGQ